MTRKEREELNELSLKAYGVKSKWQSKLKKGFTVPKKDPKTGAAMKVWYPGDLDEIKNEMLAMIEEKNGKTS